MKINYIVMKKVFCNIKIICYCKYKTVGLLLFLVFCINVYSQDPTPERIWMTHGNEDYSESGVNNFFGTGNNVEIRFITNNIERMRLDAGGNLGIGTTNPIRNFHVNGSIRFQGLQTSTQTTALMIDDNGDLSTRELNINNWNNAYEWGNHSEAGYLTEFAEMDPTWAGGTNTTDPIFRHGKIGLGTNDPQNKLHIHSLQSNIDEIEHDMDISFESSSKEYFGKNTKHFSIFKNYSATIQLTNSLTGKTNKNGLHIQAISLNGLIELKEVGNLYFKVNNIIGVSISEKGKVGINTCEPMQNLDINGRIHIKEGVIQRGGNSISATSDLGLYSRLENLDMRFVTNNGNIRFFTNDGDDGIGESERMIINSEGLVGIGTNNPDYLLDINGDVHITGVILSKGVTNYTTSSPFNEAEIPLSIWDDTGGNRYQKMIVLRNQGVENSEELRRLGIAFHLSNEANENESRKMGAITVESELNWSNFPSLNIWTRNEKRITVLSNGKVGIGTTNPQNKLDVCGIISSNIEVVVETNNWCDFVFEPDYILEPFAERMQLIKTQQHLPNILPESEIFEKGVPVSQTLKGILQNVEEMYLYMEKLENRLKEVERENFKLKQELRNE